MGRSPCSADVDHRDAVHVGHVERVRRWICHVSRSGWAHANGWSHPGGLRNGARELEAPATDGRPTSSRALATSASSVCGRRRGNVPKYVCPLSMRERVARARLNPVSDLSQAVRQGESGLWGMVRPLSS